LQKKKDAVRPRTAVLEISPSALEDRIPTVTADIHVPDPGRFWLTALIQTAGRRFSRGPAPGHSALDPEPDCLLAKTNKLGMPYCKDGAARTSGYSDYTPSLLGSAAAYLLINLLTRIDIQFLVCLYLCLYRLLHLHLSVFWWCGCWEWQESCSSCFPVWMSVSLRATGA